jgi:hypothetical protein
MGAYIITKSDTDYLTKTVLTGVVEAEKTTTAVNETTNVFTIASHGWSDGDIVRCTLLGNADGIALNGEYYVRDKDANTFKLSATLNGTAIDETVVVSTFPKFKRIFKIETVAATGDIYVGVSGIVHALLAGSPNTDVTTAQNLGAITFKGVPAGTILKGPFKKVFSTTTTATDMVLITFD